MNTFFPWLHQHDVLLLIGLLLGGSAVLLSWLRCWIRGRLIVWSVLLLVAIVFLLGLRTPPASVSEPESAAIINTSNPSQAINPVSLGYMELSLDSLQVIQAAILSGDKPTLVEIYADFGIS